MEAVAIGQVWKFFAWLPGWLLRRFFKPETLSSAIYFDVRPRKNAVTLNLGGAASYSVWFQIINKTPFSIEFDRAEFEITFDGVTGTRHVDIKRFLLKSGEQKEFVIRGDLADSRADQICKAETDDSTIDIKAYFNSKIHPFEHYQTLERVPLEVVNRSSRLRS